MSHSGEAAAGSGSLFYYDTEGMAQEVVIGILGSVLTVAIDLIPKWETAPGGGNVSGPGGGSTDNAIVRFDGTGGTLIQDSSVILDDSDRMGGLESATFNAEHDNGLTGSGVVINWQNGQKQKVTISESGAVIFFTSPLPAGPGNFLLKMEQGGTFQAIWPTGSPGAVLFPEGRIPALTSESGNIDIFSFYYDGEDYFSVGSFNFQVTDGTDGLQIIMKILIQWAKDIVTDWEEFDSSEWLSIPKKSNPDENRSLDSRPGWINKLCVQGVQFSSDHYSLEELPNSGLRVYAWSDTPSSGVRPGYTSDTSYARIWDFAPLAPDELLGGAINTNQSQVLYLGKPERNVWAALPSQNQPDEMTIKRWSEFIAPDESKVRHGKWIEDVLYMEHENFRTIRGWREWGEHLDEIHLDKSGKVRSQRKAGFYKIPDGTKTFFHTQTAETNSIHIQVDSNEDLLDTSAGVGTPDIFRDNPYSVNEEQIHMVATTPSNEPTSNAWPEGDYRYQMDAIVGDGGITYGTLNIVGAVGHFARVNAAVTSDLETKSQQESAFSGTGIKLSTTGTVTWSPGDTSDRFECVVAGRRDGVGHGNNTLRFEIDDADHFADGPWVFVAPPVTPTGSIVINELGWMGTDSSATDEWIELFNNTDEDVDMADWSLNAEDGTPSIAITGVIVANGYYLLERTDDTSISGVLADQTYTGAMVDGGEDLVLRDGISTIIDSVMFGTGWPAGVSTPGNKRSMERISPLLDGSTKNNWCDNNAINRNGANSAGGILRGTPKNRNSCFEKQGRNALLFGTNW